jgi:hypothetical protein
MRKLAHDMKIAELQKFRMLNEQWSAQMQNKLNTPLHKNQESGGIVSFQSTHSHLKWRTNPRERFTSAEKEKQEADQKAKIRGDLDQINLDKMEQKERELQKEKELEIMMVQKASERDKKLKEDESLLKVVFLF